MISAVIRKVEFLNPFVKRLRLEVTGPLAVLQKHTSAAPAATEKNGAEQLLFQPGQWADFKLRGDAQLIGGYSFTSSPRDFPFVDFAVQQETLDGDGPSSASSGAAGAGFGTMTQWVHSAECAAGVDVEFRVGDYVENQFLLRPPADGGRNVFIAAGVGITPFLSYFHHFAAGDAQVRRDTSLLYSARTARHLVSPAFLQALASTGRSDPADARAASGRGAGAGNMQLKLFLTREADGAGLAGGALAPDGRIAGRRMCAADVAEFDGARDTFYLCGPGEFSDSMAAELRGKFGEGVKVVYEPWW